MTGDPDLRLYETGSEGLSSVRCTLLVAFQRSFRAAGQSTRRILTRRGAPRRAISGRNENGRSKAVENTKHMLKYVYSLCTSYKACNRYLKHSRRRGAEVDQWHTEMHRKGGLLYRVTEPSFVQLGHSLCRTPHMRLVGSPDLR